MIDTIVADADDTELLAEERDIVADMFVERARDVFADQRDLAFPRLRKTPGQQGSVRPIKTENPDPEGDHMVIVVGGGKAERTGRRPRLRQGSGDLRDDGLRHGPAKRLGDAAPPDGEVGPPLLEALLHILLHAARLAIERDEAAYGERHAECGEDRARRPALQIAEGGSWRWFTSPPGGRAWPAAHRRCRP